MNISEGGLTSLVDSLPDFLKTFDHASKCIGFPLPKPKVEIGSRKSKDNLFAQYHKVIIEHLNRQIRLPFQIKNNDICVFSIKKFELHGKQFILTEIVNLNHREVHHLYKNRCYVASKCEIFESNYDVWCIHPDCGYDISNIILNNDLYSPKTKCSGKLCLHTKLSHLSVEAIINVRIARPCARCAIFLLKIKRIPFFVLW